VPKTWAKSRGASLATQPAHETISVNLFFILLYTSLHRGLPALGFTIAHDGFQILQTDLDKP
jgi:hypothetical protein